MPQDKRGPVSAPNDTPQPWDTLSAEEYRALVGKGKRHKYGVAEKADRTFQGTVYDSKLERDVAEVLEHARHADPPLVLGVEPQAEFLLPAGIRYVADFAVFLPGGDVLYLEAKGHPTREWRLKERLLRATYPGLRLVVVKTPAEALAAVQDAAKRR